MGLRTQKLRSGLLLTLITGLPIASQAAKRVTVAQLTQILTSDKAAHKRNEEIVRQLGAIVLTERLTDVTFDRVSAAFASSAVLPALQLLADQSGFLLPPASELPVAAAPDDATRMRILEAACQYILQTLPRLPDFLASRTTLHYDDSPVAPAEGLWPVRIGLHLVDRSSREISIRDVREHQLPEQGPVAWRQTTGLVSGGEFGGTLGMILADTPKGSVTWSHWEQNTVGLIAVFDFAVPRSASHFEVLVASPQQATIEGSDSPQGGARGTSGIGTRPSGGPGHPSIQRSAFGYHGSLWIDPSTGTILRITIEAELKRESLRRAAILVEYGPVKIGNKTFICPVRSLALSRAVDNALAGDAPTEWLNETLFADYHHFDSTVRVLPDTQPPP